MNKKIIAMLDHAATLAEMNESHPNKINSFYLALVDAGAGRCDKAAKKRMERAIQYVIDFETSCDDGDDESDSNKNLALAEEALALVKAL